MLSSFLITTIFAPLAFSAATPPGILSASTAETELASLAVAVAGSQSAYARHLLPAWITISGTCNSREYVLKRDASSTIVDSACVSTSGTRVSPYDGAE